MVAGRQRKVKGSKAPPGGISPRPPARLVTMIRRSRDQTPVSISSRSILIGLETGNGNTSRSRDRLAWNHTSTRTQILLIIFRHWRRRHTRHYLRFHRGNIVSPYSLTSLKNAFCSLIIYICTEKIISKFV